MRVGLRPDDEDVGDRGVGDPHLRAGKAIAAGDLFGPRPHTAGIGAGIGLGEAEAADPFAGRELRQIFLPLLLGAVGMDRIHDEGRLDRHGRAIAAVDPLDLAGDKAVADIAERRRRHSRAGWSRRAGRARPSRVMISRSNRSSRKAEDARQQLLLGIAFGRVAHEPLLVGKLRVERERVGPVERKNSRFDHGVAAPERGSESRRVP